MATRGMGARWKSDNRRRQLMGKETQTQKFGFATGKVTCAHSGGCSCFWGRPQDRSEPSQRFGDDPGQTQPCTSPEHSAAHAGTFPPFFEQVSHWAVCRCPVLAGTVPRGRHCNKPGFYGKGKTSGGTKLWAIQFVTGWQGKLWMKTCGTQGEPVNLDGFPYFSFLLGIECRLNFILTAKRWAACVCPHFWAPGNLSWEWKNCRAAKHFCYS